MPGKLNLKRRNRALTATALVLGLGLAGCSREPASNHRAQEIRGEPINSLPSPSTTAVAAASPADPPNPAPAIASPPVTDSPEEYKVVGFDKLSAFNFEISDEILGPVTNNLAAVSAATDALIPAAVKALDQKRVELKGFMLPLKVEGGLVTEMLIMKDQSMCCYGVVPKINEWVSVKMVSKGVRPIMDEAVRLFGTLRVGEMRENGYLVGIYRLDGERMASSVEGSF